MSEFQNLVVAKDALKDQRIQLVAQYLGRCAATSAVVQEEPSTQHVLAAKTLLEQGAMRRTFIEMLTMFSEDLG